MHLTEGYAKPRSPKVYDKLIGTWRRDAISLDDFIGRGIGTRGLSLNKFAPPLFLRLLPADYM